MVSEVPGSEGEWDWNGGTLMGVREYRIGVEGKE